MKDRRPRDFVKDLHENASIQEALDILNLGQVKQFKIIERPDPPDAIIFNGETYSWIEHVDAFRSDEEARELLSSVTPGETPYQRNEQLIYSPDTRIVESIKCKLLNKLKKTSYEPYFKKYGKGILIISEQDCLFSETSVEHLAEEIDRMYSLLAIDAVNQGYFKKAYIKFRLSSWVKNGLMSIYPEVEPPIVPPDVLPKKMVELQKSLEKVFWDSANNLFS